MIETVRMSASIPIIAVKAARVGFFLFIDDFSFTGVNSRQVRKCRYFNAGMPENVAATSLGSAGISPAHSSHNYPLLTTLM